MNIVVLRFCNVYNSSLEIVNETSSERATETVLFGTLSLLVGNASSPTKIHILKIGLCCLGVSFHDYT